MSVTASVFCLKCRQFAPRIGDAGAVGFPSLKDTPATTGEYQTFGYLKKGFDAIGYKPWELEAIAAFLKAHQRHNVSLFLEGQDVRYDDDEEPSALDDVSDATEFVFDDKDFVEGLFEAACEKCDVSVRSGTERLRPFEPLTLKPAAISAFMTRVRNSDDMNFHRVAHLLEYEGEQERLAQFFTTHASHGPTVRIVRDDASHVERGQALPWKLAWQKPGPYRDDRKPLVAAGRVFAITQPGLIEDYVTPPALHCYSLDGDELWQRDLPSVALPRPEVTSEGLVLQVDKRDAGLEMLCLDPEGGATVSSRPTPYFLDTWLPDGRAFVGTRSVFAPDFKTSVGVIEWPSLEVRWESPEFKGVDLNSSARVTESAVLLVGDAGMNRSPWVKCLNIDTGRERWATSLAEFGAQRVSDYLVWRDWLLVGIGGKLLALDLSDGGVAWQIDTNYFFGWHESHDLLRGYDLDKFVAVDLNERKLRFAVPRKQFAVRLQPTPEQSGDSVIAGDEILVVDQTGRTLSGLDAQSGRPLWKHRPATGVSGRYPVLAGDRLIIHGPTGLCCYVRTGGS